MSALPELHAYIDRLRAINAPIVGKLLPGLAEEEILAFQEETGLAFPSQLFDFWRTIGGVSEGLTYHRAAFAGYIFAPVSVAGSLADYTLAAELREQDPVGDLGFSKDFWPDCMVKFAGEDSNGFWVNCHQPSPTFGSIYVRHTSSDGPVRWAADMNALFATLCAAVDAGVIYVAPEGDPDWDSGALASNYDAFGQLAAGMNPGCAAHDLEALADMKPDWK